MAGFLKVLLTPFRLLFGSRVGLPLIVLGVTVVTIFMLFASRPRLMPVETPERIWPVDAVKVTHQAIQPDLELFGEVVPGRRSQLLAQVDGRIVEIGDNFDEGGIVKEGDLLIQIDPIISIIPRIL